MPVGKSDGRRRRIDPERVNDLHCYCILQIITSYFRFLQETEQGLLRKVEENA